MQLLRGRGAQDTRDTALRDFVEAAWRRDATLSSPDGTHGRERERERIGRRAAL